MSDEDRRRNDETFRLRIIEQQAEIKALVGEAKLGVSELKADIAEHGRKISDIESALWGYPKGDSIGLLEQHRKLAKNWSIVVALCAFVFSAFGKSAAPLIEKIVTDWTYNSVSEKWLREQQRPKIRKITVHVKNGEWRGAEEQSSPGQ